MHGADICGRGGGGVSVLHLPFDLCRPVHPRQGYAGAAAKPGFSLQVIQLPYPEYIHDPFETSLSGGAESNFQAAICAYYGFEASISDRKILMISPFAYFQDKA